MKFNPNCQKPNTCEECTDRCIKDIAFLYGLPEEKQIDILRHSETLFFTRATAWSRL